MTGNFDVRDFSNKVLARKVLQKPTFDGKSFLMNFGIDFCSFFEALEISFIGFWLENSMFGTSQTRFWHGRYCKNRLLVGIVLYAFGDRFLLFF